MVLVQRIAVLVALGTVSVAAHAQADTLPVPGRVLRVELPDARHEGRIVAYQADTVVLDTAKAATDSVLVKIPRTAVSMADLHTGVSLRPYVVSGAASGGILGYFTAGFLQEDNEYAWGRREWQRFLVSTGVVAAGAVIGGVVGSIMAPDRWVRINIQPYPTGR
jgi:hypothetical protein